MARKARVEFAGRWDHVLDRGDRREAIFRDDEDRVRFIPRDQAPAWSRACLGSSASPGLQREGARTVSATPTKQSFADRCVPKLELGNEEQMGRVGWTPTAGIF